MISYAVEAIHGDPVSADDAASLRALSTRAWELGCVRIRSWGDRTLYVMPSQAAQLAMLAAADGHARSWWRVITRTTVA